MTFVVRQPELWETKRLVPMRDHSGFVRPDYRNIPAEGLPMIGEGYVLPL